MTEQKGWGFWSSISSLSASLPSLSSLAAPLASSSSSSSLSSSSLSSSSSSAVSLSSASASASSSQSSSSATSISSVLAEDYDPLVRVEEAASHALTVAKDRVTELSAQAKLAVSASIPVVQTSVASFFSFVKSVVTIDEDEYIEPEACGLTFVTRQLVGLSLSCCSSFFFAGLFSFMVSPCSVMRFPSSAPTSAAAAGALALISSFLRKHYAGRFMIFNLSEKAYDYSLFDNQVIELKFPGKEEEEEVEFEPMFRSLPGSERKFAASSYGLAHSRLSNSST